MIYEASSGSLTKDTLPNYLKQGVAINAQDHHGYTALMLAARYGRIHTTQALIAAGADINAQDKYGQTALMFAASEGFVNVVQALIAAGALLNTKDTNGYTALMWATYYGKVNTIQALIAAGADSNAQDNNGYTALMWAASEGNVNTIQALIAAGIDKDIVNEKDNNLKAADYTNDKAAYDKAVAAGEKERAAYFARQKQAIARIAEEEEIIPDIAKIIAGYAYDSSATWDLPENTQKPTIENSWCTIQ